MKHLNKITISNARRFGSGVEIDFGQGATILLAPNGTGKTTVFEAIEFALTGAVQRLTKPPLALIRDNEPGLDIRLDFEDNLHCAVSYRKGSEPVLSGNHSEIFKNRNIDEIPYLLRLTHLLEQRGASWFVQQSDSNVAGSLLDKLSIGKELTKIYNSKTGATRAANSAIESAKKHLEESKIKLESFQKLLENRKNVIVDFTLHSLKEIKEEITGVYANFKEGDIIVEEKLSAINSFAAVTISILNSKIEDNSNLIVKLAKIEGLVAEYISNKRTILANKELLQGISTEVEKYNIEIESIKSKLKEKTGKNNEVKLKLNTLIELRDLTAKVEATAAQKIEIEKEIVNLINTISSSKESLAKSLNQIEKSKSINDKYKSLTDKEVGLAKIKSELESKQTLIKKWDDSLLKIGNINDILIPNLIVKRDEQVGFIKANEIEINKFEKERYKSQETVTSLKGVHDSISEAVSIIANNLPKDKGDCPVCAAEYTPSELQNRISKAVSYINPLLTEVIKNNKTANDKLNSAKTKQNNLHELLANVNKELEILMQQKIESETFINEKITPYFTGIQTPNLAKDWLKKEMAKVENENLNISKERIVLPPLTGLEEIEKLILEKQKQERQIEGGEKNIQIFSAKLNSLNEELNNLQQKIGAKKIDEIRKEIIDTENLISKNTIDIEKLKQAQLSLQNLLEEQEKLIKSEKSKNAQMESRQSEINAEWIEVGLSSEPKSELLKEHVGLLSKEKVALNKALKILKKIEEELAKWSIAEAFEKFNTEIKNLCGTLNEEEFLKKLTSETDNAQKECLLGENKRNALQSLYKNIGSELETTHGYLRAINPVWNSLLKRVVVNPRFADTLLNSYTYRSKPQAEVKVKMHGTDTDVVQIASEAQITDLQLTFMLSMANTYHWTPWRGLLLDDPTQHHDLVHSASVFDLLRDYIVNKEFQILLGTHDSVHANFFKRKLYNDGIPAKIWSLKSDDKGVKAELLQ